MKQLTVSQHYLVETLLDIGHPVTVDEFIRIGATPAEKLSTSTVHRKLESLYEAGWVTKRSRQTGRRGAPPKQYELVDDALPRWQEREALLQEGYRERERWTSELLG